MARAKFYASNKEKVYGYVAAWRDKNPEKYKAIEKRSRVKTRDSVLARAARYKERLADAYVSSLLGLKLSQAPKELIELKRIHLKIERQLRKTK